METFPQRHPGCPTDLELEQLLAGDSSTPSGEGHTSDCPHCAARLEWMRQAGQHFTAFVFPRTREEVARRLASPRGGWLFWLPAFAAVGAVASALLLLIPPPDYLGQKGSGAPVGALEVYVGEGGQGRRLSPGEVVHPGDGLRFVVQSKRAVFILSIDSTGQVSRIYPPAGANPGPAGGLLPGGAILDEVTGPERIFAIYPEGPLGFEELEAAARRAVVGGGPELVRRLERLPLAVPQESVLLEKVPR